MSRLKNKSSFGLPQKKVKRTDIKISLKSNLHCVVSGLIIQNTI